MKNIVLYKYYLCTFLFIYIQLTVPYKIPTPEVLLKHCLRVTFKDQFHAILVEDTNGTDTLLKECIIKKIHVNQSISLHTGLIANKQTDPITSNQPNLIIMTNSLTDQLFDIFNLSLNNAITFHCNLVYIVVTENDGVYKCNDGKFHKNTFNVIRNFMNDLWFRFEVIRVVLVFPYSCPYTYVIYGKNIPTNMPQLNRTIISIRPKSYNELSSAILKSSTDLTHGYPVRISIFPRFPTSLIECEGIQTFVNFDSKLTNGYCGLDGLIMQDAIKYFKFNMIFSKESLCNQYGYANGSQTVFGSLGCVINGTVDISFNARFMVMYPNENFHYLQHVMHDSLCALLPVPNIYALWHYPHMPLDSILSVVVIVMIVLLAAVAWLSGRVMKKITGEKQLSLRTFILDFATSTLCGFSLKKYKQFYFLRGLCLGCSIIVLSYYQGYINYSFTTLKRYEKIKTLQQLFDLKYVLYTSPPVLELLKPPKNPNNSQEDNFLKRAKLQGRTDIGIVLERPQSVSLGRYTDVRSEILLRYGDRQGKPMIYVVEECFRHYYLSYISRFDFPFTENFKVFMERLVQAGIPDKYYKWTRHTLRLQDTMPMDGPESRPIAMINMKDQSIAFGILLFGYVVSIVVFILEKWMARRTNMSTGETT